MSIEAFVAPRLREQSAVHQVRQMTSALEMIADVHREANGSCHGCDRPWPCATIRTVAWAWSSHPDYDHAAWRTGTDHAEQPPLTAAEKDYLVEHGGVDPEVLSPERLARVDQHLAEHLERMKYVVPFNSPWGLREVIDALPPMSHGELVALLNAPLTELNDDSLIEWLANGGSAWVVMDALLEVDLQTVAERATQIWPLARVPAWLVQPNDRLDGARPIDVVRLRGPNEVLDALDSEQRGTNGCPR